MPTVYFAGLDQAGLNQRLTRFVRQEGIEAHFVDGDPQLLELEASDLLVVRPPPTALNRLVEIGYALAAQVPVLLYGDTSIPWLAERAVAQVQTGSQLQDALRSLMPGLVDNDAYRAGEVIARVQQKYPTRC
jgi:hypothetical protein